MVCQVLKNGDGVIPSHLLGDHVAALQRASAEEKSDETIISIRLSSTSLLLQSSAESSLTIGLNLLQRNTDLEKLSDETKCFL